MYKSFKYRRVRIAFEKFNPKAKTVSYVYKTGIWYYKADDSYSVFFVVSNFRIILSLNKQLWNCSGKAVAE